MRLGKPAEAAPDENSDAPLCALISNRPGNSLRGARLLKMKSSHKVIIPMKSSPKSQQKPILRAVEAQPHLDLDKGRRPSPGEPDDLPIALSEAQETQP